MTLNKINIFIFTSIGVLFLWDIGNPDALRQGTEGFYLQISKEMYRAASFLTPLYLNSPHWSKPPLHFWTPFPLYHFFGEGHFLLAARLSIFIIFILGITHISLWIKKLRKISFMDTFIFLTAAFGFLKYSRIFMMEIPFSLITFSSLIFYYDYLASKKKRDLSYAIILLGLSILIKGPITLIMTLLCLTPYHFYLKKKSPQQGIFNETFHYTFSAFIIASLWFIACTFKHGLSFLEYFFMRENLGKFTAKSYPLSSVFQGLMLYGLPWSLFLPLLLKIKKKQFFKDKLNIFLLSGFITFFSIWLIPGQKSHHYALPSLPFFLLLIYLNVFQNQKINILKGFKQYKKIVSFLFVTIFSLFIIVYTTVSFSHAFPFNSGNLLKYFFILLLYSISSYFLLKRQHHYKSYFLGYLIFFATLYCIALTSFILPTIPKKVITAIGNRPLAVIYRKPYFISNAIQREVTSINSSNIKEYMQRNDGLYLLHDDTFHRLKLSQQMKILHTWPVWRRGNSIKEIITALRKRDLTSLQKKLLLLRKRPSL